MQKFVYNPLQMRCSQAHWFGQKQKWDSRPKEQSLKCESQTSTSLLSPTSREEWKTEPPLSSPFCQVFSALFSPFSPPASQGTPGGNSFQLSPQVQLLPLPMLQLLQLTHSYHIPSLFLQKKKKEDVFWGFLYIPVLQICTELS